MTAQTRTTSIEGVSIKTTAKGDLFVVKAGGVEYSTFARGLADQARQLAGQTVELRFTEKTVERNGNTYTNRYYEGAELSRQTGFGNDPAAFSGSSDVPPLMNVIGGPGSDTREIRIMRQTATKVAANLMPYLPESERTPSGLLAMADFLVAYYQDGTTQYQNGDSYPTHTDPGSQLPPFTSDSDIPFAPTIDGFQ